MEEDCRGIIKSALWGILFCYKELLQGIVDLPLTQVMAYPGEIERGMGEKVKLIARLSRQLDENVIRDN